MTTISSAAVRYVRTLLLNHINLKLDLKGHTLLPLLLFESVLIGEPSVVVAAALVFHGDGSRERVPDEADGTGIRAVHRCGPIAVTVRSRLLLTSAR